MEADDRLIDLATRVADGAPIDWSAVTPEIGDASVRVVVEQICVLEQIAAVYGSLPPAATFATSLIGRAAPAPATWGPLAIVRKLGSGTYADVYLARDPKLDRPVALKLLRHRHRSNASASEVIEEARLLARVRHPNVVTVYGADLIDERVGIWMEYIDGRTLEAEVRERGPLPPDDVIQIGRVLCDALTAVHQAGLLHRDVKAQNVMRSADGRVVLTDFGTGQETSVASASGELGGTPLYLAPEVLNGQPASVSSDVYSFGVLLYHLATGSFPVSGRSLADLRERHARLRGSVRDRRPSLRRGLASAIDRATDVEPLGRFSSAEQLKGALPLIARERAVRRRRWAAAAVIAVVVIGSAVVVLRLGMRNASPVAAKRVMSTELVTNSAELPTITAAISPDGLHVAYVDLTGLFVKDVLSRRSRPLQVQLPADVNNLAWLPDSLTVLAAGPSGVWRTTVYGDPLRKIHEPGGLIAASPDGRYLALTDPGNQGIRLLSPDGHDLDEIIHPEAGMTVGRATFSPDGQRIACGVTRRRQQSRTVSMESRRLDGTGVTVIASPLNFSSMVWAQDGRIVFATPLPVPRPRYQQLWEVRVDPDTAQAIGDPTPLWQPTNTNFDRPSLTADGKTLVFTSRRHFIEVVVADFDEKALTMGLPRRAVFDDSENRTPSWTPHGDGFLFISARETLGRIYRQELRQQESQPFVPTPASDAMQALMSPDAQWIFYLPDVAGSSQLMRAPAEGGAAQPLLDAPGDNWLKCAWPPASMCVMAQSRPRLKQVNLLKFDPSTGQLSESIPWSKELTVQGGWDLSPDGTEIVALSAATRPALRTLNLQTKREQEVTCEPCSGAIHVAWTANRKGWIVVRAMDAQLRGSEVLYVDRSGRSTSLWTSTYQFLGGPVVSPDGKRIAFSSSMIAASVWMLQGF